MNPRLILAFLYQAGPLDELVEAIRRHPWRAVTFAWMAALSIFLVSLAMARADVPGVSDLAGTADQNFPASPLDIDPSIIACNAQKVSVAMEPRVGANVYRAEFTSPEGSYYWLGWTDTPTLSDRFAVEAPDGSAYPDSDPKAIDCLRERAVPVQEPQ